MTEESGLLLWTRCPRKGVKRYQHQYQNLIVVKWLSTTTSSRQFARFAPCCTWTGLAKRNLPERPKGWQVSARFPTPTKTQVILESQVPARVSTESALQGQICPAQEAAGGGRQTQTRVPTPGSSMDLRALPGSGWAGAGGPRAIPGAACFWGRAGSAGHTAERPF